MPSGYNANLPNNIVLDEGVVFINSTTALGVTSGPWSYDNGETWQNPGFAGKRSDTAGMDRVVQRMPKLTGQMISVNSTLTPYFFPGSSQTGSPLVVTPVAASGFVPANATNLKVYFKQGDGTFFGIVFAKALMRVTQIAGRDKDTALFDVTIEAKLDLSASTNTDASPVKFEIAAASIT